MPIYFQRPENALKRANEFIEVGKKEPALDALYDVIKSKKHRTWQNKIHEPILFKYLQLCVDLRRSHHAKEGMYQYKLICQQVNIASLEEVIRFFLKLSEDRAFTAQQESREQVMVDDLDQIQTPESVLLSFVSGEGTQDRTDRVMLTPWVKFLWEAYRNVLELLRNNIRVEKLYHETAQLAFKFCLKYTRRTEFRKLCDSLRNHLNSTLKHQGQPNSVNLNNPDSLQMHLETRLAQLDSAISMELWQEAFKAVEDVYGLMQLSKRQPKPQVMANYYEKVALVFWKAENYLFHACTLNRLYVLLREQKKSITVEETQKMACRVLLATLAIPIPVSLSDTEKYMEVDEITRDKSKRLAGLLSLQNVPTRDSLITEMLKLNVLQQVLPQIQDLYQWMEEDFAPLQLCSKTNKIFEFLAESAELDFSQYIKPLQEICIVRLLKQVSQVYQTIEFSKLLSLIPFANEFQLERAIVDVAKQNDLQVRLDHRTKSVSFGLDLHVAHKEEVPEGPHLQSMPSERLRNQLALMSYALHQAVATIQPASLTEKRQDEHDSIVQNYLRTARKEHKLMLDRKAVIEARKEHLELENLQRERREREQQHLQKREEYQAEQKRLLEERKRREAQKRRQDMEEIEKKQAMDKIAALKKTTVGAKALKDLTQEEIEAMGTDDIIARQVEQLDKEKRELQTRLKTQEKKVDYFARAMRLEEVPLLKKQYEEHLVADKEFWEQQERDRIATAKAEHENLVETNRRLERMVSDKDSFVKSLTDGRKAAFEEKLREFNEKLDAARKERLEERRKKRIQERKRAYQEDKEEARRKALEEKKRKEREEDERKKREEKEAEERKYKEKIEKLNEQETRRRERELEIERRATADPGRPAPVRDSGTDGGSWRAGGRPEGRDDRDLRDGRDSRDSRGWGREPDRQVDSGSWRRDDRDGDRYPPSRGYERDRERDRYPPSRDQERDRYPPSRGFERDSGPWRRDDRDRDRYPPSRGYERDQERDRYPPSRGFDRDQGRDRDRYGRDYERDRRPPARDFERDQDRGGWRRDDPPRDSGPGGGWRRPERDRDEPSSWRRPGDQQDRREPSSGFEERGAWRPQRDQGRGPERDGDRAWRRPGADDRDRGDGRTQEQWRREAPAPERSEAAGRSWSASRRGRGEQSSAEQDPDGWTTVQYK